MKKYLKIAGGVLVAIGLVAGIAAFLPTNSILFGSALPAYTASTFETYLATQQATTDTTATLAIGTLRDGTTLTGYQCLTIDANTPAQEYECGTANGTSITGLSRGIDAVSGTTTVASLVFAHRRGADVKISDYPILTFLNRMANGVDTYPSLLSYATSTATSTTAFTNIPDIGIVQGISSTASSSAVAVIEGGVTFGGKTIFTLAPTASQNCAVGSDLCDKTYVDSVAVAGASNADVATKGIVQEATVAQINAGTASGSTGARLDVNPAQLANSTYASTTDIWYVATGTNRVMDKTLNLRAGELITMWSGVTNASVSGGTLSYRISSPWSTSTTTIFNVGNQSNDWETSFPWMFLATTTETVTFEFNGGNQVESFLIKDKPGFGFANSF